MAVPPFGSPAGGSAGAVGDGSDPRADALRLSRALFPELARELDRALERATASSASVRADFDARLDAAAEERFAGAGLAELAGTAGGARLARAFASTRRAVAELLGADVVAVPEPEAFAAAGSDLAALAQRLGEDPVLVAVLAPRGLGADVWRAAFARAVELPGSAFAGRGAEEAAEGPIVFASEVARGFAALDAPPAHGTPTVPGRTPWTLRLVPAGPEPAVVGLNFSHGGPHVALPEILMLQLTRAIEGQEPIDRGSFTWLSGELADGRLAARHVFDAGTIRITAREVGSQGPHLGARPPIAM